MEPHETADAYRAARLAGDADRCQEIVNEATARFSTRTTDGEELLALYRVQQNTPLGTPQS